MEKRNEVCYNMELIKADGLTFSQLNERLRQTDGPCRITGCLGQRFIAAGMGNRTVIIDGVPGNALGAYLSGADITVNGNAQDAVGDTMNDGRLVIHGSVGDAAGYAMRGGTLYIRDNAGYRTGIHIKAYQDKHPVIVIGGRAGSFLGEYQAGGLILVLGRHRDGKPIVGNFPAAGMHGGKMILRGNAAGVRFPEQTTAHPITEEERREIAPYLQEFGRLFGYNAASMLQDPYTVITPNSQNPYRQMYVAN